MTEQQPEIPYVDISIDNKFFIHNPKQSNYTCYLFGGSPGYGLAYTPQEARVNLLNKLQKIMSEIEVEILPGDGTIDKLSQGITQHPRDGL